MKVIYAKEEIINNGKTIFLAGPSPRNSGHLSWRVKAIELFEQLGFKGTILVPEDREKRKEMEFNYIEQIDWEEEGLTKADLIIFWIPRDLDKFPGFTTNIEWGVWTQKAPDKLVLGSPSNAPKMGYLNHYADKLGIPRFDTLEGIIEYSSNVSSLEDGNI